MSNKTVDKIKDDLEKVEAEFLEKTAGIRTKISKIIKDDVDPEISKLEDEAKVVEKWFVTEIKKHFHKDVPAPTPAPTPNPPAPAANTTTP